MNKLIPLTKADFELFKKDYREFQELLGLTHWKTYFKYKKYEDGFACTYTSHTHTATVIFPLAWDEAEAVTDKRAQIRSTARHEVLHLFFGELTDLASQRFIASYADIERADEYGMRLLEDYMDKKGDV